MVEKEKPPKTLILSGFVVFCYNFCGETGIRTLGPPYEGQRFSRPPHSTALASLR